MNNNQNTCYVFSTNTLDIAIQDWLVSMIKLNNKDEEKLKIVEAALPWFLEHIQADTSIYMFTHDDLLEKIETWKKTQLEHFPKQKARIDETCDLIISFFNSDVIKQHKMIVEVDT